jgi:hypothetical protein
MVPMPWPVTHILAAEIFYNPFFNHLDHKGFIIGTCFSDIRYPARLSRSTTHPKNLSLSKIQAKSAFQAGLSFHSYVDEMWNQFVLQENHHIFDEIPHNKPMIHTMKVLQDKYLYNKSGDWSQIANYFEDILPEEKNFGAAQEMVERWHSILAFYLSKPPNIDDLAMLSISLDPAVIKKIEEYYLAFQDHQHLNQLLLDFYDRAADFSQEIKTT